MPVLDPDKWAAPPRDPNKVIKLADLFPKPVPATPMDDLLAREASRLARIEMEGGLRVQKKMHREMPDDDRDDSELDEGPDRNYGDLD